jgi:formylglycine-generating enzyme required for sulfatase activity
MPNATRRDFLVTAVALAASRRLSAQTAGATRTVAGIDLQWCPPGTFLMGSPPEEPGRRSDERQVRVRLTRGYWMGRCEVTQGQWLRVMSRFPDRAPSPEFGLGDDVPMYWVNHHEALTFCARATEIGHTSGDLPRTSRFHLPTEAQWEYACRAGSATAFAFGPTLLPTQANFGKQNVGIRTGLFPANAWGIHDMHGNIFEWCRDWYHAELPGGDDPDLSGVRGLPNGDGSYSRVRRGGAWNDPAEYCRSAQRFRYEPDRRSDHIGFRVIVEELRARPA